MRSAGGGNIVDITLWRINREARIEAPTPPADANYGYAQALEEQIAERQIHNGSNTGTAEVPVLHIVEADHVRGVDTPVAYPVFGGGQPPSSDLPEQAGELKRPKFKLSSEIDAAGRSIVLSITTKWRLERERQRGDSNAVKTAALYQQQIAIRNGRLGLLSEQAVKIANNYAKQLVREQVVRLAGKKAVRAQQETLLK